MLLYYKQTSCIPRLGGVTIMIKDDRLCFNKLWKQTLCGGLSLKNGDNS